VRDLKKEGTSGVLVTHNLYHFLVCDRFVVMSHGARVFAAAKKDTSIEEVTDRVIRT
jgi:simple sugar transport system ATP-binding protein